MKNTLREYDEWIEEKYLAAFPLSKLAYRRRNGKAAWDKFMNSLKVTDFLDETQFIVVNEKGKLERTSEVRVGDTQILQMFHWHFGTIDAGVVAQALDDMTPPRVAVVVEEGKMRFKAKAQGDGIVSRATRRALTELSQSDNGNFTFLNSLDTEQVDGVDHLWVADMSLAYRFVRLLVREFEASFRKALQELRGVGSKNYEIPTHDTTASLIEFIRQRRKSLHTNDEVIPTMPMSKHGKKSSRTWGIEVESGGARGVHAPKGWDRKGDGSLYSAYDSSGTHYIDPQDCDYNDHREECDTELWYSEGDTYPDGTIATASGYRSFFGENPNYTDPDYCEDCGDVENDYNDDDDDDCGEFVSPILHSFHSQGLEKLTKRLSEEPQNDSSGVHVHVEARDLTPKQIGSLVFAYQMIEPLIEASYRRVKRMYCKTRPEEEFINIIRDSKTAEVLSYAQRVGNESYIDPGDRYVTLNLCSLGSHGTVEFRAMGPVYEYEYLVKWAFFCREMVNCAKNNAPGKLWNKVKTFEDVQTIFQAYGSEYNSIVMDEAIEELTESALESLEV